MSGGIDATASKQVHDHIIATVPEPSVTFERDELQYKLERRDMELKRKDKELEGLSKEVSRLQKEVKVANAEMTGLRDRNEQLQQSLMNSRLANQNARDDADTRLSESRIRELELALSTSIHKTSKLENELESAKQIVDNVDARVLALNNQIDAIGKKEKEAMENLYKMSMQLRTAQQLFAERDKDATELRNEKYANEHQIKSLNEAVESRQKEVDDLVREGADLKKKITDMTNLLNVRAETNAILRQQMDELNGKKFVITKEEMDRFKKIEKENGSMQLRIKELVKSVDLHMDLLHRAEGEAENAVADAKKMATSEAVAKKDLDDLRRTALGSVDKLKAATKELVKLRRDNKDLILQVEGLQKNPNAGKPEFESLKESLAILGKSKADAAEQQQIEAKKRKSAEESTKAMRNRISFLLEQLEQASALSIAWQEQKSILKAEIAGLHSTNKDLRRRLSSVQGYYTERQVATIAENDDLGEYGNGQGRLTPGDILSGKAGAPISALGPAFENPAAATLPTSVESYVERALFDTICAFSSGSKTAIYKAKKRGQTGPMGMFKVRQSEDGVLVIEANADDPDLEVEAKELLTGLQINAFLRFCQTRPASKVSALFVDKIANILNQSRNRVIEVVEQLGDTRMEVARATARAAVSSERVQRLRERFYFERLAKQKSVIKYVREQMRHSDMRVVLNDISKKAADYIVEIDIAMNADQRQLKEFMQQITHTADELSSAAASSGTTTGPVGAMEIRLPDTQLDDETLHGVIGLLSGVLEDHNQQLGGTISLSSTTPLPNSLLTSSLLAKTVLSTSANYINRVLQIIVKGNQLTDLSCKLLSNVVETSPDLRLLDLRENCISEKGAKILFDATRRNISILYVTQRQGGFMVEGHREIAGGVTQAYRERVPPDHPVEFERLVGTAKHPLRIDIRHNDANPVVLEGTLESAMLNPNQYKGAETGFSQIAAASSSSYAGSRQNLNYTENNDEVGVGNWSPSGLIDSVRKQEKYARPLSAMTRRADSGNRPPVRPQSAIVGGRSASPGNVGVKVGARALMQPVPRGDDDLDASDSEAPYSARRPTEEHRGLIDMIETGSKSGTNKTSTPVVGSILDESIRHIQETDGILPSPAAKRRGKKKKSVNEMILTDTKRVYVNKMHFPGEEEALAVIEARRRATQASMSAGGKHDDERKRPASASSGMQGESKGGGMASAIAASAVRSRINAAKEQESRLTGTSTRPLSASITSSGSKKSGAHTLLNDLQKLNPGTLF